MAYFIDSIEEAHMANREPFFGIASDDLIMSCDHI